MKKPGFRILLLLCWLMTNFGTQDVVPAACISRCRNRFSGRNNTNVARKDLNG